ncbi:MAG TPA: LLM class F420-dependent oxidoreductase [Candidatus Binataceae bacterium]|nr:LLM class F420-dependent oxidoreductase [Candidatus Binataceae bacterium]
MPDFGLIAIPTHYTIQPAELARWAEAQGFESLWFGEHSHIPTSRKTPFPLGGELPVYYKEFFDPFIGLSAAAAVTTKIKVGTSVCLVPEHNTMNLAKMVACLDHVSNGRLLFGIGAGWNAEEMADHGAEFKDRWKITRERILAMREIWSKDVAEYHGKFVNFDPLWCWPKPVQAGGPPVILGAWSKWAPKRVAEYCDGWIPLDVGADLAGGLEAMRTEAARLGRPKEAFDLSVLTGFEMAPAGGLEGRIQELLKLGFNRVGFLIPVAKPDKQWPVLERYASLIRKFA